jgi:site-specific recombinase XerD
MLLAEMKLLMPTDSIEWAGKGTLIANLKTGEPLSYWATRDAILALYKKAEVGLPRLPWHCLRHAFCTELADAGVPIHTIKDLAGHSSIETTLRYMHTGEKAKQDAITQAFESSWRKDGANQEPKSEKPSKSET